jgi:type I restriction enzyme M protein
LDITWLKDKSPAGLDNLPDPDSMALDIVENLEDGLESFKAIITSLHAKNKKSMVVLLPCFFYTG